MNEFAPTDVSDGDEVEACACCGAEASTRSLYRHPSGEDYCEPCWPGETA